MRPKFETTTSKRRVLVRQVLDVAQLEVDVDAVVLGALAAAFTSIGSALSIAVTVAPAARPRSATSPVPVARSRTRSPGATRSRSTQLSWTGANRAASRS